VYFTKYWFVRGDGIGKKPTLDHVGVYPKIFRIGRSPNALDIHRSSCVCINYPEMLIQNELGLEECFVFVFIYILFNDAVNSWDFIASNERMVSR
jgi:hypothetical protein